jgi:hypothetical protein
MKLLTLQYSSSSEGPTGLFCFPKNVSRYSSPRAGGKYQEKDSRSSHNNQTDEILLLQVLPE